VLLRSNTASLVQEAFSSKLDSCSPFLLDQSLLKASFFIGCPKEPVHVSRYDMHLLPEHASLTCSCKVSTVLSHASLLIHTQTHLRYLTETSHISKLYLYENRGMGNNDDATKDTATAAPYSCPDRWGALHSAPITVGKHLQAKLFPIFRCSCFTRRCLNAEAFLVE
jgi:hypothetical protein